MLKDASHYRRDVHRSPFAVPAAQASRFPIALVLVVVLVLDYSDWTKPSSGCIDRRLFGVRELVAWYHD
jgi:hypothetical protein